LEYSHLLYINEFIYYGFEKGVIFVYDDDSHGIFFAH